MGGRVSELPTASTYQRPRVSIWRIISHAMNFLSSTLVSSPKAKRRAVYRSGPDPHATCRNILSTKLPGVLVFNGPLSGRLVRFLRISPHIHRIPYSPPIIYIGICDETNCAVGRCVPDGDSYTCNSTCKTGYSGEKCSTGKLKLGNIA